MATPTNEAKIVAALDLTLKALRTVAGHLRKLGSESANDAAARLIVKIESAEALLRGGKA
jgi:hypothetical protein